MRKRSLHLLAVLCLIVLSGLTISGCGEKSEPKNNNSTSKLEPFTLVLDFFPNADHAGIYAALESGEYKKAGLDLKIQTPSDPAAGLKQLIGGQADLAISYQPEVLLSRDRGADLVSVGALVQKPLTSLIALKGSKIKSVKDLKGKRIGTAGIPYQTAYLKTILDKYHINTNSVKVVNVGYNLVPSMISKNVDATLGGFWNYEGIDLKQRKKNPLVLPVDKLGVPTYSELMFTASRKDLKGPKAAPIRRFLQATTRGFERVKSNPKFAVDALLKNNTDLDRRLQTASVKATTPFFFPSDTTKPFGYQQLQEWGIYGDWMFQNKLLKDRPNVVRAFTNDLLPGEGFKR